MRPLDLRVDVPGTITLIVSRMTAVFDAMTCVVELCTLAPK